MASVMGPNQTAAMEKAFASKNYKFGDAGVAARAQQLVQQLHISPESFANQYDSFALIRCARKYVSGVTPLALPAYQL